jgi:glutathione transport system ATP-binding protein
MYLGRIVELGPRQAVFEDPRHPYTKSLMLAVPIADPRQRRMHETLKFKPVPSPMFPLGHEPERSAYDEVAPGHYVLRHSRGHGDTWQQ